MKIEAVVFDVGETLIDETRFWVEWARWWGVSPFTLFTVMGSVLARGGSHREALEIIKPGYDPETERAARAEAGYPIVYAMSGDLYPDSLSCIRALKATGYKVGIAGNQSDEAQAELEDLFPVDFILTSGIIGYEKPAPRFFDALVDAVGASAPRIAYVGDRLDNDVMPAMNAGMTSVFIKRGPWAYLTWNDPMAERADIRITSLDELPVALADYERRVT